MRFVLLVIVIILSLLVVPPAGAQVAAPPAIVTLKVQGIDYARQGWTNRQPLLAGTLVTRTDVIFPQRSASLLVMCPDGNLHEFLQSELIANTVLNCPVNASAYIVGDSGVKRLNVSRGGRQDPTIPYLISPRATLVRQPQIVLRWNAVPNVDTYTVTVRGGSDSWTSPNLPPEKVVQGDVAQFTLENPVREKVAYTVELCVVFKDATKHCTSDPDWSFGANLAFYYVPTPAVDAAESQLIAGLGADTPESLYARAVLLSQPVFTPSPDMPLGVYSESISLLEHLVKDAPNSDMAASPETYNLLGELYRDVSLPLSAARAYQSAARFAKPGTEAAAIAALGQGMTSPDADAALTLYNSALDNYAQFLDSAAFDARFTQICRLIGDQCLDLARCQGRMADCTKWSTAGG